MLFDDNSLKHWIDHFYGYGSWQAPIWFVSYEEGGGDLPEEVAAKVNYFEEIHKHVQSPTLCDIRELYKRVPYPADKPNADKIANLYEHRFDRHASLNGEWKNLIAFIHGFNGKEAPDQLKFQRASFLLSSGEEAMIRLYPLPSPHNHAWYYSWLDMPALSFIKTREGYESHLYPIRVDAILEKIKLQQPRLVLMYGMNNINELKESIAMKFPDVKFKLVKAIKMEIPQHHITDLGTTKLLITTQVPTLRHNRIESGFEWYEFGKTIAAR